MKKAIRLTVPSVMAIAEALCAISAVAAPNLAPYQPSGWTYPVVVTRTSGSTTESTGLLTTDTLYADWAVINNGSTAANNPFQVYLYIDGVFNQSWTIPSLGVNFYDYVTGISIGSLSAGSHTVATVIDPTHVYSGTSSGYTNTITVGAVLLAAPTLTTPPNGSTGQFTVPYFVWSSVASANSYRILIATNPSDLPSGTTATNGGASVVIDAVAPTTNFSPTIQLNPNTTYYWEVHAISSGGEDGTWSTVESFTTGSGGNGITIVPTFDSSITSDPQAATIEATINAAIAVYHQNFSNQIIANITFVSTTSVGLGENTGTWYTTVSYSSYLAALVSSATSADDAAALANLPSGSANPVNGNGSVNINFSLARALGFGVPTESVDSTILLNTPIMNLSSTQTKPNDYSLFATVSHEIDEVLGLGSALNGLANGDPTPTGPVEPEDLFRYDQNGNRSLTTSLSATSYFSFDGTNDLAQFNQFDGGDFGDWYSYNVTVVPQVQDAFSPPGANPVLGVELRVLDAIGYTRVFPPSAAAPPQITGPRVVPGYFDFNLSGTVGSNYVVQSSSNLLAWIPLSTNTIPGGGSMIISNAITNSVPHFYRAKLQ